MNKHLTVFQRYEKKYLLTRKQYQGLLHELKGQITADDYGKHTIGNIYFDTDNYQLIRTSLSKPDYKEKLRLRCYGLPASNDAVFIELKKKVCDIVYKRRVEMSLQDAHSYLKLGDHPPQMKQIHYEINWFIDRYQPSAKVLLSYDRSAYFGNEDNELRITFDENIRWRQDNLDLTKGLYGDSLLSESKVLMEIKIPGAMPLYLSHALTRLYIYPTSFSKYGYCYENKLLPLAVGFWGKTCA